MKKVFIDSDIFVREIRYPRDANTRQNKKFLEYIQSQKSGITSIFNVLEICGILSFNLNEQDLLSFYADFATHFKVKIVYPADDKGKLDYDVPRIFQQIQNKRALGDAQIAYVAEKFADHLDCFVSWNAAHFKTKLPFPIFSPDEFFETKAL